MKRTQVPTQPLAHLDEMHALMEAGSDTRSSGDVSERVDASDPETDSTSDEETEDASPPEQTDIQTELLDLAEATIKYVAQVQAGQASYQAQTKDLQTTMTNQANGAFHSLAQEAAASQDTLAHQANAFKEAHQHMKQYAQERQTTYGKFFHETHFSHQPPAQPQALRK